MAQVREYLISVIAVAVLCGFLTKLTNGKSSVGVAVKLMAGFLLLLAVVHPWSEFRMESVLDWSDSVITDGSGFVAEGENLAQQSYRESIIRQTKEYIVDEAKALQCEIHVEVTLSSDKSAQPSSVYLTGQVSPYARQALTAILTEKLGIQREDIIWT